MLVDWRATSDESMESGIIIATSHDRWDPPNGGLVREMGPLISGKNRLVKYYSIWPDCWWFT